MSKAPIVKAWFSERLASGALARDTEAYNQVVAAMPDLISRIDADAAAIAAPIAAALEEATAAAHDAA